jgi:hypothetical protein
MFFPQSDIFIVFNLCSKYIIDFQDCFLFFYVLLIYRFLYRLVLAATSQDFSCACFSCMRIVTDWLTNKQTN